MDLNLGNDSRLYFIEPLHKLKPKARIKEGASSYLAKLARGVRDRESDTVFGNSA
ncbi:hypothetical protein [Candidatus Vallotia cooleyia]|uniref:hypothetical protein n=1 Tax=Candidatus Vallotiella adelgis TaxID=1177211 RepID=UPI001D023CE2|nr:hypothetical protein [Candidatus Vallotia cooleyia]UDG82587.1 hypothetical protein GJV44_00883 [Candidatus Vallotia cooleyia]